MVVSQNRVRQIAGDGLMIILGSLFFAVSVAVFSAPNEIVPGGFTGLSTLLNNLFGTPIGAVTILLNLPVILWAMCVIGYRLVLRTVSALVIGSLLIDLLGVYLPPYQGNPLLAAITAGVLEGIGLALIFLRGGTTGGTVLIARLLRRYFPHISMGKLLFGADFVVILLSMVVYRSLENGLYALIAVFVGTKVVDRILYGVDLGVGKMMFIISEKNTEIADWIITTQARGGTILYGKGAYSGREKTILLCAVRNHEMAQIKKQIHHLDPNAFVMIGEASQIAGEGFFQEQSGDMTLKELLSKKKQKK